MDNILILSVQRPWSTCGILLYCLRSELCPMRLLCTAEDECKWFFTTIWFILLIQIIKVRHWLRLHLLYTMKQGLLFHNVTYSVHDEFLMSHRARLVVLPVPPWTSCLLHCCRSTAYLAPHWGGPGPPLCPPTHGDPNSLRVHALTHPSIRYIYLSVSFPLCIYSLCLILYLLICPLFLSLVFHHFPLSLSLYVSPVRSVVTMYKVGWWIVDCFLRAHRRRHWVTVSGKI
jgi:hypothetical protein